MRFKIQNAADEAAQVAAYIDARLVFDRLDHVCGERWSASYDELPQALVRRRSTATASCGSRRPSTSAAG